MSIKAKARGAASETEHSKTLTVLARAGYGANGLLHLLLGYLAIRVALHRSAESDQSGALAQLAGLPGGAVALWAAVVGFAALGLWFLLQALLGIGSVSKKRWVRSLSAAAKALIYLALGWTTLKFALGGSSSSRTSSRQASATVLNLPGGVVLLVVAGVVTAGIGAYFLVKGIGQKFRDDIRLPQGTAQSAVVVLGVVGYVAKGVALGALGVLLVIAAVTMNPGAASGLDGALKSLVALPFGQIILIAVGVGLIAYGLYGFARARLARL